MYKYYSDHDEINSQNSSPGNFKDLIQEMKNTDPGYTCIYRKVYNEKKQRMQRRKMEVYTTSSGIGANIRNAETGENFVYKISKMKKILSLIKPKQSLFSSSNKNKSHLQACMILRMMMKKN